jgi:hypothetical protein
MYVGLHVKYPLVLSDIIDIFSKNIQISDFMKIHPVGAEFFHADGRTDGRPDSWTNRRDEIVFSKSNRLL